MSAPPRVTLALTAAHHAQLHAHLFPEDGFEAVAVALCGRRAGRESHRLLVREVHLIPYEQCTQRSPVRVSWSPDLLVPLLERADAQGLSVVKVHSHRAVFRGFSPLDDAADHALLPCVAGWLDYDCPHASAVMLPDGSMLGRAFWRRHGWSPLQVTGVIGPDLRFWPHSPDQDPMAPAVSLQAFGAGTTSLLRQLTAGIVGCSGTGSIVIEQLHRLEIGRLVLVDPDRMAERNLGRIPNSTMTDARNETPKVDVLDAAVQRTGLGTTVRALRMNLWEREAVEAIGECDVVFGCMDSHEGRFLLNLLATYYLIPYFDIGVRLDASTNTALAGIREACGSVHYLQPGKSSLVSRGLVSLDRVREEGLRRKDPAAYHQQIADGYIHGAVEQRPAVISVNMFAASLAVNDFLARVHPYREEPNASIARIEFSLASMEFFCEPEGPACPLLVGREGLGDVEPRLGLSELSRPTYASG